MYEVVSLRVLARSSVLLKAILILQQVVLKAEVGGSMLIEESQGRYEKVEKKRRKKWGTTLLIAGIKSWVVSVLICSSLSLWNDGKANFICLHPPVDIKCGLYNGHTLRQKLEFMVICYEELTRNAKIVKFCCKTGFYLHKLKTQITAIIIFK